MSEDKKYTVADKNATAVAKSEIKEPFVRIAKRDATTFPYRLLVRLTAGIASFLIIVLLLSSLADMPLGKVLKLVFQGSFFTEYSREAFVKDSMLLLCVALALLPAYKMKFWNVGAQGQILIGALVAGIIMKIAGEMLKDISIQNGVLVVIMLIAAIVAGGIWAAIPAFFKVRLNANETLFTLMMNYVAIQLTAFTIDSWKGTSSALPQINLDTKLGYLGEMFGAKYGFITFIVIVIAVFMYFYMKKTKHGYEISVVGESINTAKYAGMKTGKIIVRTLFLSGAVCGLCGFLYVSGVDHIIQTTTSGSYGFTAIIVAWAASFSPIGMAVIAFIISFLSKGTGNVVNYASMLNSNTTSIMVGLFLFILIGSEFFINYRLVYNTKITARQAERKLKRRNQSEIYKQKHPKITAFFAKISDIFNATVNAFKRVFNAVSRYFDKINLAVSGALFKACKAIRGFVKKLFVKNKKAAVLPTETNEGDENNG